MKLKQISLFLENKPGYIGQACRILADAGVNIATASLADTADYGILRILTKDDECAKEALEKRDFVVKISEVVAVAVPHQPGGLADVLEIVGKGGYNIEYMYGFFRHENFAVIVFRFDDPDSAIDLLTKNEIKVMGPSDLFD